jgi:3D (Asp-Asp-Asp) domain-containing protein/DNA-binding CsgD family transcriptional regulator
MISSAEVKAHAILESLLFECDRRKLYASNRSQEKIELIRAAVCQLLKEGIPTAVIAKTLKICQGSVQYHARKLESKGKIKRCGMFWGAVLALVMGMSAKASTIYVGKKLDRKTPKKVMMCRITAYWQNEDGWTSDLKSSTGRRLISGKSCAVDPKIIPYGSNVIVEGKRYVAHDTGTAVISRKASKGAPVVDVFYKTERQAQREMNRVGRYAKVAIE